MVQGWTLDDLETVMREATADSDGSRRRRRAHRCRRGRADEPVHRGRRPLSCQWRVPVVSRAARRRAARVRARRSVWKPLVVIVLLGVLATAVALVLLQSAGIISWGFLGPTA